MNLIASFLRHRPSRPTGQGQDRLPSCRSCGSGFIQLEGWRELPGCGLILNLRCPECHAYSENRFEYSRAAVYDEALVRYRRALLADYETLVRHNMRELADRFRQALELDLIGADDFAVPQPAQRGQKRLSSGYNRLES